MDHSKAGDTILIAAGTYFENVKVPGQRLTFQGVGRRRVIIDGNLNGPVFTIGNAQSPYEGDTITFSEVTITRGQSDHGGGIQVLNESPLVIQHSILLSNRSTGDGGGVYTPALSLTIADCNLINNQAVSSGGGVESTSETPTLTISDSVFSHNSAGAFGGAVDTAAHVTQGTITNSSFVQNQAGSGGALSLGNLYGAQLQLTDVTVSGNTATENGGGLIYAGSLVLSRSVITHNKAGNDGGGILSVDRFKGVSSLSLVDSDVNWNTAVGKGGGAFLDNTPTVTDSTFTHNSPDNCVVGFLNVPTLPVRPCF